MPKLELNLNWLFASTVVIGYVEKGRHTTWDEFVKTGQKKPL